MRDPAVKAKLGEDEPAGVEHLRRDRAADGGAQRRRADAEDPRRRAVAGGSLRGGAGHRRRLPEGDHSDLAAGGDRELYGSIFPSVQNLLLAARAAGLGAALITLPLWSKFLARRALGLPWSIAPCAVIPLGWPKGRYGPTTRRPVGEVVSLDRYGNRPFRS